MADSGQHADRLTLLLVAGIGIAAAVAFLQLAGAFCVAAASALLLLPLHRSISRRIPAWLSAALLTTALIAVLAGTFAFLADLLIRNADEVLRMLEALAAWTEPLIAQNAVGMLPDANAWPAGLTARFTQSLTDLIFEVPLLVVEIIVFALAVYSVLLGGDRIYREVAAVLPERSQRGVRALSTTFSDALSSVVVPNIAAAAVTFIIAVPFFAVFGYGDVLFFASLTALFRLLPVLGLLVLITFLAVYAAASGDHRGCFLLVFVGYPLLAVAPGFLLRPLLAEKRIFVRPALVLLGFIGGVGAMGFIGVVLGPLFVVLLITGYRVLVEELEGVTDAEHALPENRETSTGEGAMPGE
ncbi:AI-2E family transporter [Methanoculleus sp. FWC-SCC1]|uniref:AI-2E family transporter n=1 Tax=Methanoculleus frigidifontis TaxID=2584085 RepID=A0ABT8MAR8_9EURY|nr:AI-2E family transporter [Methanoculleus sp. FWC-SCC1]MDN7025004.1 AI-2E family transporter [Methanoculleus sp. FWC-SCC1]